MSGEPVGDQNGWNEYRRAVVQFMDEQRAFNLELRQSVQTLNIDKAARDGRISLISGMVSLPLAIIVTWLSHKLFGR
jgi:hypothetical protein